MPHFPPIWSQTGKGSCYNASCTSRSSLNGFYLAPMPFWSGQIDPWQHFWRSDIFLYLFYSQPVRQRLSNYLTVLITQNWAMVENPSQAVNLDQACKCQVVLKLQCNMHVTIGLCEAVPCRSHHKAIFQGEIKYSFESTKTLKVQIIMMCRFLVVDSLPKDLH